MLGDLLCDIEQVGSLQFLYQFIKRMKIISIDPSSSADKIPASASFCLPADVDL